jgi:hypothetical protein
MVVIEKYRISINELGYPFLIWDDALLLSRSRDANHS